MKMALKPNHSIKGTDKKDQERLTMPSTSGTKPPGTPRV